MRSLRRPMFRRGGKVSSRNNGIVSGFASGGTVRQNYANSNPNGVISVDQLNALCSLEFLSSDHIILMRHRAVLFGLLGGLILYSIWQPRLRFLACVYGLISMIAFVVLAFAHPSYGQALHKVVIADIVASAGLVAVLMLALGLSRKAL